MRVAPHCKNGRGGDLAELARMQLGVGRRGLIGFRACEVHGKAGAVLQRVVQPGVVGVRVLHPLAR